MATPISPESVKALKDVAVMVTSIDKDYQACEKLYTKLEANAKDALETGSAVELGIIDKQFAPVTAKLEECIRSVNAGLELIRQLGEDSALMDAKGDAIQGLAKNLAGKQKMLAGQIKSGRDLEKQVSKAATTAEKSDQSQEAELDALESEIKALIARANKDFAPAAALEKKVREAADDGDLKEMHAQRLKFQQMEFGPHAARAHTLLKQLAELHKDLSAKEARQLATNLESDLKGLLDDCSALDARYHVLLALKVAEKAPAKAPAPPKLPKLSASQVAKIAEFLPIDAKDSKEMSRLLKLLNDNPYDDWQKMMIKLFGWKKPDIEKGMKKIEQLNFVKPLYLIDI